jgi:adenosylmethionine-8-amino-7-oxononanoate aminotransferase
VVQLDRMENLNTLRQSFIDQGVFIRPFGSIVYLTPAFTVAGEELAKLTDAVTIVLGRSLGRGTD